MKTKESVGHHLAGTDDTLRFSTLKMSTVGRCTGKKVSPRKSMIHYRFSSKKWPSGTMPRERVPLKKGGRRAARLAAGDRHISEKFRSMKCICGCSAEPDPAHLASRRYESTRHREHLIIPLCRLGHEWLDHTPEGVKCRAVLLEMAQKKGAPLTHEEFWPVASAYGLYEWMARKR